MVTQPGPEDAVVASLGAVGAEVYDKIWRSTDLPEERGRALATWVNSERPDVYVISISPDTGWLALPLLDPSIPTVCIAHNDVGAFYAPVEHYAPLIDCAVGVSYETTRRLRGDTGMPPERVRYIPYGINSLAPAEAERRINMTSEPGTPLRIGYVGRVVEEQKRVREFVALALELRRRAVAYELHIIGDGNEKARLEAEFRKNGFGAEVRFWGWLSPEQVTERFAELDVFVLLSDYEGLPVALLEAMGHVLVPVVTDIASGNTQLIHDGRNGLLFPVGDVTACVLHLARLFSEGGLLRALRRGAWMTACEYSIERMAGRYKECFRHISAADFPRAHRLTVRQPYPLLPACRSRYPPWLRKIKYHIKAWSS